MKKLIIIALLALNQSCTSANSKGEINTDETDTEKMKAKNTEQEISCKLTSTELQERKSTVIAGLRSKVLERKELANGFAYRFSGEDAMVDELAGFVKSERSCCSFLIFTLSFSGDGRESWLTLEGPDGAKEMINAEIGL
jgi:hypothetical protein